MLLRIDATLSALSGILPVRTRELLSVRLKAKRASTPEMMRTKNILILQRFFMSSSFFYSFLHMQGLAPDLFSMKGLNGLHSLLFLCHFHKSKAFRLPGDLVIHDLGRKHLAKLSKESFQLHLIDIGVDIFNK